MTVGVNDGGNFTHFPQQRQALSPTPNIRLGPSRRGVLGCFFRTAQSSSRCGLRNPGFSFPSPREADKHVPRPAMPHAMPHVMPGRPQCRQGCCSVPGAAGGFPVCPHGGFVLRKHQRGDAGPPGLPCSPSALQPFCPGCSPGSEPARYSPRKERAMRWPCEAVLKSAISEAPLSSRGKGNEFHDADSQNNQPGGCC